MKLKIQEENSIKFKLGSPRNIVDQSFNPQSSNAQSGVAVAEALANLPFNNIKNGEAEGSINTINSKASAKNAFAQGFNTKAGSKAFRVIGVADNGDGTGVYTLNAIEGLEVDMQCYAQLAEARGDLETITAIDPMKNEVIVSNFNPNAKLHNASPDPENFYENNYLIIVGHPELGDIEVGFNANAEGEESMAQDVDSHAGGYASKSIGKYSLAYGVKAISGYCAFALGYNVAALAVDSFAIGTGSKVMGYSAFGGGVNSYVIGEIAFAFGHNARAIKDYSIALGRYAWAYSKDQFVTGRYNFVDYNDKYAVLIGNGKSEIERSNAFMLDWEGNGYYAGDVYANSSNGEKLEENRLITKKELDDALNGVTEENSWKAVQDIVRSGYGLTAYPVGSTFSVQHKYYGNLIFEVVAHNNLKKFLGFDYEGNPVVDENAPTMTLMTHRVIGNWEYEFDAKEKERVAYVFPEGELVEIPETITAGTKCIYSYSGEIGSGGDVGYYFTAKINIPKGSYGAIDYDFGDGTQLLIFDNKELTGAPLTLQDIGSDITSYDPSRPEYSEIIHYTHIVSPYYRMCINDPARATSGSNNYKESAIRQFLNSQETKGNWWKPQTIFDNPPSYANTKDGFLYGIEKEFLDIVGTVNLPCSGNGKYEYIDPNPNTQTPPILNNYTLQDKFYLPSFLEVGGSPYDNSVINDNSKVLDYYDGASNVDRKKFLIGSYPIQYKWWMLRTPHVNTANNKQVTSDGNIQSKPTMEPSSFAVMCTIA